MVMRFEDALQYFPEHVLLLASQLPLSFWHCSSAFFAAVSPAKAGTVSANARVTTNIEMKVFMTSPPLDQAGGLEIAAANGGGNQAVLDSPFHRILADSCRLAALR